MSQPTNTTIVLCPGQGAQHAGMGRSWATAESAAAAVFKQADAILGTDLSTACFNGPDERIHRTDTAQPAIYTCSIACLKALESRGAYAPTTLAAVAGLSLGEFTALHLAGVFSFEEGLKLVAQRGRFMQEAAEASNSGMVALIGADESQANALCDAARGNDILVAANFNCPGQIVISGSKAACERSLIEAGKIGIRATAIPVAGAFHSPLMQPAADRMADALARVTFHPPRVPVPSNVTGKPHGNETNEIKRLLVEQITSPVRWEKNVRWLVENVKGRYIEPAPGKVLTGLMRRIEKAVKVENFAEAA